MTTQPTDIGGKNAATIDCLLERSGLRSFAPARLTVEHALEVYGDAAVDVSFKTASRVFRLRFDNRDEGVAAFVRTKSFNVRYLRGPSEEPLDGRAEAILQAIAQRIAASDPGGLTLERRSAETGARRKLALIEADLPERAWRRDLFDAAFDKLVASERHISELVVVVAQACEMSCSFCPTMDWVNMHLRPSGDEGQYEDLVHQLKRGREVGATCVDFGGNDVLRYPPLLDFLEAAGRLGYKRVIAQSPGQILSDRSLAEAVSKSSLTELCLPIYGRTAEIHDAVTGRQGAFDGLCRAIDNVRELGSPKIRLHTIALASTVQHLEGLLEFCRERFDLPLLITPLRLNRQGEREVVEDMAGYAELRPIIERHPDSFRFEFPQCQLPPSVRSRRAEPEREELAQNLYDSGLPVGSEDAAVAAERQRRFPPKCDICSARSACCGVLGSYLERFGDADLTPIL